jgi:deoxyribodipyrimidine photo-lyase
MKREDALRATSATLRARSVHEARVRRLNDARAREAPDGAYVLLWAQSAQRTRWNEALEYAVDRANDRRAPLVVVFCSTATYPEANERHVGFMLEGLCEMRATLGKRRIAFEAFACAPPDAALAASERAIEVVTDSGYLRLLRAWREDLARRATCAVTEIETECVVPQLGQGARRAEPSAATFRPKVLARVREFTRNACAVLPYIAGELDDATRAIFEKTVDKYERLPLERGVDACLNVLDAYGLKRDPSCPRVSSHVGGESRAKAKLDVFLTKNMLSRYHHSRNDPCLCLQSHLSPHIHYGQISVVEVARKALAFRDAHADEADICASVDVFLDELIVRRELAVNFALRNPKYDSYDGLPEWARETLERHRGDRRERTYTLEEFEHGRTHDKLWNASQRELVSSGKQHNYLRMYWGKKILEWSSTPEEAWRIAMTLNNRYSLDGRNMVSLTGVGWCFGLHDREFHEASITGTIRRFSESGMRKKFPAGIKGYLERWGDDGGTKRQLRLEDVFGKRSKSK